MLGGEDGGEFGDDDTTDDESHDDPGDLGGSDCSCEAASAGPASGLAALVLIALAAFAARRRPTP